MLDYAASCEPLLWATDNPSANLFSETVLRTLWASLLGSAAAVSSHIAGRIANGRDRSA